MWKMITASVKAWSSRMSMRSTLVIAILAMGLLAMALALGSGWVYRHQAMDNQRLAHGEMLAMKVDGLLQEQWARSRDLILDMQAERGFTAAIENGDINDIVDILDRQFLSDMVLAEGIMLVQLEAYDAKMNLLARSSIGLRGPGQSGGLCGKPGAGRLQQGGPKTVYDICLSGNRPYYVATVPIGSTPAGFIQVTTDLLPSLVHLEPVLNTPLQIALPGGAVIYNSGNWSKTQQMGETLTATHTVHAPSSRAVLKVSSLKNIEVFSSKLARTQYTVLIIAAVITLQAIFIALYVLQRMAINPLQALAAQLRRIRLDKEHLGQHVPVAGNIELSELGKGFNAMTTRLKELYASLEQLAFTDLLTKLPNRTLFNDRLYQTILTARREGKPFALFIMDLDRFKDINDSLGHHVGDLILEQVGQRLKAKLRESDTVARMGGDEFAILLPTVSGDYSAMAARMLLKSLRVPFEIENHSFDIGASIGIALYPDHGEDASTLIQHADVAMYAAKNANSGFIFYSPGLSGDSSRRLALMTELRHAIQEEEFFVSYQPKVDLQKNRVSGVEALVRWRHPSNGVLLPDVFIPLLEQTGLIRNLTPWVLTETLGFHHQCRDEGLDFTISVNLSVRDLQDPHFIDTLEELLAEKQMPPSLLEMEITESALMTDPERALDVLTRLAGMGIARSIDDFGTGYSSLAYLKKLPVSSVKIDKSFVINMTQDENDATIVRSSIDLAHNMGLKVVAEGVENEETLELLKQLGCDYAQGNVISEPLAPGELRTWLRESPWTRSEPRLRQRGSW